MIGVYLFCLLLILIPGVALIYAGFDAIRQADKRVDAQIEKLHKTIGK